VVALGVEISEDLFALDDLWAVWLVAVKGSATVSVVESKGEARTFASVVVIRLASMFGSAYDGMSTSFRIWSIDPRGCSSSSMTMGAVVVGKELRLLGTVGLLKTHWGGCAKIVRGGVRVHEESLILTRMSK
jgi:hypothetical protein